MKFTFFYLRTCLGEADVGKTPTKFSDFAMFCKKTVWWGEAFFLWNLFFGLDLTQKLTMMLFYSL